MAKTVVVSLAFSDAVGVPSLEWGDTLNNKIGYPIKLLLRVYDGSTVVLQYAFRDVDLGLDINSATSSTFDYNGVRWRVQDTYPSVSIDGNDYSEFWFEHPVFDMAQIQNGSHSVRVRFAKLKVYRLDAADAPVVDASAIAYSALDYSVGYPVLKSISVSGALPKQYVGHVADLTGITAVTRRTTN